MSPISLSSSMPKALVIRAAGTNCDAEMLRAFGMAGAKAELVHLDRLIEEPRRLYPALRQAVIRGCPMIGACNGFQVLVQVGLLPGPATGEPWPEEAPPRQTVALTDNQDARFHDRWVGVQFEPSSVCIWTKGMS